MKVILTTGDVLSKFDQIHRVFESAGIEKSRYISPITNPRECSEISFNTASDATTISHDIGLQVIAANSDSNVWGWSQVYDSNIKFWAELHSRIFFVLVYSSPEYAFIHSNGSRTVEKEELDKFLTSWILHNEKIIAFYHQYPDRCLLMNSNAAITNTNQIINDLNLLASLNLPSKIESNHFVDDYDRVELSLIRQLISDYPNIERLHQELESISHLSIDRNHSENHKNLTAWNKYVKLKNDSILSKEELSRCDDIHKRNTAKINELTLALTNQVSLMANFDLERHHTNISLSENLIKISQLQHQNELLNAENEFILYELQQSQERIDKLATPEISSTPPLVLRSEVLVDMCEDIDGDNWYYAEQDGRWAGPESTSRLRISMLQDGEYEARFEVVDAIDKRILSGTIITLNGAPLQVLRKGRGVTGTLIVKFSTIDYPNCKILEFELKFPKLISPAQHGSNDSRMLSIRVKSMQVVKIF